MMRPPRFEPFRDLVVLQGGPLNGQWFYADDFEARQLATRRTLNEHSPEAAGACLNYRATKRRQVHPHDPGADGTVFVYGRQ